MRLINIQHNHAQTTDALEERMVGKEAVDRTQTTVIIKRKPSSRA